MNKQISISMTVIFIVLTGIILLTRSCRSKLNDRELFRNEKFVIVSAESSGTLTQDKFHSPVLVKMWLIQRVADTTQFAELVSYSHNRSNGFLITNELWYNKSVGDTLFFKYICKDRFFTINKHQ
jgi:hypothetical protein